LLVYLFLNEAPRFPHVFLKVTCPKMRAGRITNYAAFDGRMVPAGRTCLCVEFFAVEAAALLDRSHEELRELAQEECVKAGLVDGAKCFDCLILKMPEADAATHWRDWLSESKLLLLARLQRFENFYNVNRAGTDVATYAGMKAADAILSGDRSEFDYRTDPTRDPVDV